MVKKRVVISGVGVLASNGIGKEKFFVALFEGRSGIKPISIFDTSLFKSKLGGEINDFRPEEFLGAKGLRTLDRSTKLVCSASKLALDNAGLKIDEKNADQAGVVVGTILGSVASISDFHKEAVTEGPRYVNPALFPNTVINSPASQVSIKFNIRGFNATIATGFTASLDAIKYAADFLRLGRAKVVLAGGVEELCIQTFLGFYKTGFLAGVDEAGPELSCPYDARRNGMIFGEAAVIFVLEDLESALERKADILAEVTGYGSSFDAFRIDKYNPKAEGLKKAMRFALDDACLNCSSIDFICAAGNSMQDVDLIETEAIKAVFKDMAKKVAVSSVKSMLGECFSASGGLQVAASLAAIERQSIPPTINYEVKDPKCDLDYVTNVSRPARIENVLVDAFGPSGSNASLVVSRFKG